MNARDCGSSTDVDPGLEQLTKPAVEQHACAVLWAPPLPEEQQQLIALQQQKLLRDMRAQTIASASATHASAHIPTEQPCVGAAAGSDPVWISLAHLQGELPIELPIQSEALGSASALAQQPQRKRRLPQPIGQHSAGEQLQTGTAQKLMPPPPPRTAAAIGGANRERVTVPQIESATADPSYY